MSEESRPVRTIKVQDGSYYAMLLALYELWQYFTGTRDSHLLGLMASQMDDGLREEIHRLQAYQDLIGSLNPTPEELESEFLRCAQDARVTFEEELLRDILSCFRAECRLAELATSGIGNQAALRTRHAVNKVVYVLAKHLTNRGDAGEWAGQRYAWTMNTAGRARADQERLAELEQRLGLVYVTRLFGLFAYNDALPEQHRFTIQRLAYGGQDKYGRVQAHWQGHPLFRCYYDQRGPCECGNRPPPEGVSRIKKRLQKYPDQDEGERLLREVSVAQLDEFMTVVYGDRNGAQGLERGADRANHEDRSEGRFAQFQISTGGAPGAARQYGELMDVRDRRWHKAFDYAHPDGRARSRLTSVETLAILRSTQDPFRKIMDDVKIAQVMRHGAIDIPIWGPLYMVPYYARFEPAIQLAMQHIVAMLNATPGRSSDFVLELPAA